MRNFLRVLRLSWAYRGRIIVSGIAALFVALFWSLNLSAVYPVLQILSKDQNLQEWVTDHGSELVLVAGLKGWGLDGDRSRLRDSLRGKSVSGNSLPKRVISSV